MERGHFPNVRPLNTREVTFILAHLRVPPVFACDPLVLGLDRQFVLGGRVVQSRAGLRDRVQVDGLDGASGWKNTSGPGRLHRGTVCFGLLRRRDLLSHFATTQRLSARQTESTQRADTVFIINTSPPSSLPFTMQT